MISSLQRSHHISPASLPFSQLAAADILNSSLSTDMQSCPVLLSWTGLSKYSAPILYCGTLCQLDFACGQISYPKLKTHLFDKSYPGLYKSASVISYEDPRHLTWQVHGHQTNSTRLSNSLTNNDLDSIGHLFRLPSYYIAWRWEIFMFGV